MSWDFCSLVRRDHDDLDRALVAISITATPVSELPELLDVLRLALWVHATAEAKVLDDLAAKLGPSDALRLAIARNRAEHRVQDALTSKLGRAIPGSEPWYGSALELRIHVLDHASRAELLRWVLDDHVPIAERHALAGEFATERMRVLSRTAPSLDQRPYAWV